MNSSHPGDERSSARRRAPRPILLLVAAFLLVMLLAVFLPQQKIKPRSSSSSVKSPSTTDNRFEHGPRIYAPPREAHPVTNSAPAQTAEEIVSAKLAQFGHSRRQLARALALVAGTAVPDDVERFFDAIEAGNWEEIDARFKALSGGDSSAGHGPGRRPEVTDMWSAIVDAYGAAEQVHLWPPQKLLDYGNALLGSLRPGMIYVGGTDNGRWIPELLNDTSDGEQHIVLTQNGLADGKYLEYVNLLYGDRLTTLSQNDSQHAFQDYIDEARKRFQHDQQFPDEPKQVLPGENISFEDNGRAQVSGQVAVMQINERLLQRLMQNNPDQTFALQESFPLRGTYAGALPLGPLMQLGANGTQTSFTSDRAAQVLDYWTTTANAVLADPEATASEAVMMSYSHDVNSSANLLAAHDFIAEAERAYRLANQLWPADTEAINGLAELLTRNGQIDAAAQLLNDFAAKYPSQRSALQNRWSATIGFKQR